MWILAAEGTLESYARDCTVQSFFKPNETTKATPTNLTSV